MGSLAGVRAGDSIMVRGTRESGWHLTTAVKVGRIWVTDAQGRRYTIERGTGESTIGYGSEACTVADHEASQARARVRTILQDWGLWGQFNGLTEHALTDEQKLFVALVAVSFGGADALALELARLSDETLDLVSAKAELLFRTAAGFRFDREYR
jgi:hypothetical protein